MAWSAKKVIRLSLVCAILVVGTLAALLFASNNQSYSGKADRVGGDFTLSHVNGPVSLQDFHGQVVVLYFGFTECHEVCPTSMTVLKNALLRLQDKELAQIQSVFISVDPARDTLQKTEDFAKSFHNSIVGIGGSSEQVKAVADKYHAYFKEDEVVDETDYKFRHSSRFYIVNKEGVLVDAMRHSTTANELIARLKTLVE